MTARGQLAAAIPEAELLTNVIELAQRLGYLVHHCRPARRESGGWSTPIQGDAGFMDLVLVHPQRGVVLAAELKSQRGRTSRHQLAWLGAFRAAGIPTFEWRPSDWLSGAITRALTEPTTATVETA